MPISFLNFQIKTKDALYDHEHKQIIEDK